jgi:hypothetical protein
MEKGGDRLRLSFLPGVTKHLRPPPLCGTTSGLLFRLSETPPVSLGGINVFPWILCLTLRFTPSQCI